MPKTTCMILFTNK